MVYGTDVTFLSWYFTVSAFLFGAIIGSFLNVVIYRFHTGKSLNGHSHCMSCQHRLSWFELLPIVSYVVQRGKCRKCGSYIPVRYILVELTTAVGFLVIYLARLPYADMALTALLFSLLLVIAVYDVYHMVIPNELVLYILAVGVCMVGLALVRDFSWVELGLRLTSGVLASGFFGFLFKYSKGRWLGFGDVKLAFPLGILVSYPQVFSMIVLSFWVGAIISIVLLTLPYFIKRGQFHLRFSATALTMKSEIPFAPFLIAGFILSYFFGVDVLSLVAHVLPL